jgi:hypothetical protein
MDLVGVGEPGCEQPVVRGRRWRQTRLRQIPGGITRRFLGKFGLNLPHVMTNAWDFRLSQFEETLVTVTLKDGSRISGWCGPKSCAGSAQCRDLYADGPGRLHHEAAFHHRRLPADHEPERHAAEDGRQPAVQRPASSGYGREEVAAGRLLVVRRGVIVHLCLWRRSQMGRMRTVGFRV